MILVDDLAIKADTCPHCVGEYVDSIDGLHMMTVGELVDVIRKAPIQCGWREGMRCLFNK